MNIDKLLRIVACVLFILSAGSSLALADVTTLEGEETLSTVANASLGYRFVDEDNITNRAREYDSLDSGPLFNAKLFTDQGRYSLDFDIDYLNENDYTSEFQLKTKKLMRMDLRSERFFHNLDHIPYDNGMTGGEVYPDISAPVVRNLTGTPVDGSRPDGVITDTLNADHLRTYYTDDDANEKYGIHVDTNEVKLKIKLPTYPAHFNLAYWRYEKEGKKQLRFAGENCTTACHMQSTTRKIDRITEEVKAGVDAHVGFVDLAVEGLYRVFRDREQIPGDDFGSHSRGRDISNNPDIEHDEDPDSSVSEVSLKANMASSGGLVGSASFTLGERENHSDLTSVGPIKAETDYYKTAADVTYTPGRNWTFNLRYRLLDMESDNTDQFTDYDNSDKADPLDVRDAMDLRRAWYEAIANYRPSNHLTLKAEVRREDIHRSETGEDIKHVSSGPTIVINPNWELPDDEVITRAKIGFNSRFLEKSSLKVRGWLALQHNDDPAYGTSFGESQELFLATSYTPSAFWGLMANADLMKQENNDHELHSYSLDRKKQQQNMSLGTWINPRQGLSFDLNYGYLHTNIEQDLLFGAATGYAIEAENVDYRQTVQTITLGMSWQIVENLSCRVEGHHIRSEANYSPEFESLELGYNPYGGPFNANATSADLKEISKVDIRQNGLRGRVNWQIDKDWSCAVEAALDDYDEQDNDTYDGAVMTTMVNLSRSW